MGGEGVEGVGLAGQMMKGAEGLWVPEDGEQDCSG